MQRRSVAAVIFLSIITCGIYGIYWNIAVTNEIQANLENPDGSCSSGIKCFLFSIISCGFYTYYWYYKQAKRLVQMGEERDVRIGDNSVVYLILTIFGFGIISVGIMQSDMNRIADVSNN